MHERTRQLVRVVPLSLFVIGTSHDHVWAQGQDAPRNAVSTGELLIEPPTLINLGFEWFIQGDGNRNAAVEVSYREQGETGWSSALPLLGLQGERVLSGTVFDVIAPNMFAGSILYLEPDTDYQALSFGTEEVLFDWQYHERNSPMQFYDVSPDGSGSS